MLLFLVRASQGFPDFLPLPSPNDIHTGYLEVARGSRPFPSPNNRQIEPRLFFFFSFTLCFAFPQSSKPGSATIYRSAAWSFYQMRVRTSDPTG
ncbi:uncharacterized protein BO88DRAFT_262339 [Aspergillus vadensis CBS 113365]|uniref:Uncharacterized protein n=1 Tax=Aspergillus vadensis (strain CBS 113365 / IMI 142717 / IBT 24658) TaxID=1448311 RepID=A0A319BDS5_ASPVC|nr:hypothetical protein BO88DRAFT_262339 [Aspergillus vadensis CBS 113365]PYH70359.1 hypothetical protein BO88DRAFT_262339 [Aspergillus vadensis CBS 113365]